MSRYPDEAAIAGLAERFLACTLPKAEWTHAAHFGVALYLVARRPDLDVERAMPGFIRRYNEATGVANSDTGGYHATITQASLRATRAFHAAMAGVPLARVHGALMAGPCGDKDWLLAHWSRERLFSVEARRAWVAPDLAPLPF